MNIIHLDYESRSAVDLKSCGAFRYAVDPTTDILMCGVSADDSDEVFLWINPKFATPDEPGENAEAEALLKSADLLVAHNAPFELAVTWGFHQKHAAQWGKFHFPKDGCPFKTEPAIDQWRCTMATARKAGLPQSLDKLGEALGLDVLKDIKGKALIRFFCVPNKEGKFNEPKDHMEKWLQFCSYCRTDVRVEKRAGKKLKPFELTGSALETFQFDLRLNLRGIPVNQVALRNAARIIETEQSQTTIEFRQITGINPTQREEVRKLVGLGNMQSETVDSAIKLLRLTDQACGALSPEAAKRNLRVLELYQKLSFSAVKKIAAMLEMACPDGRVRGCHVYHGTVPGRWAARGIQPQNFKKTPAWMRDITDQVYAAICRGVSSEYLDTLYGAPFELLSGCIRHFLHLVGTRMLDADYSSAQARIICWLAKQDDALDRYRKGVDSYKWMATRIYGIAESSVDADQREVGKRVILGCGFQMGAPKFKFTCEDQYGLVLPLDLCERGVQAYRDAHQKVRAYWYFLDNSARSAIKAPGERHGPFMVRTIAGLPYLLMTLPSGRSIAYPHPKIELGADGDWQRDQVTYWGQDPYSEQWTRVKLYGGKLAENMTMGVEADIMAHGCITAEKRGFDIVAIIHDQALSLKKEGQTPEQYVAALVDLPVWARNLPIKADGREIEYYRKG